MQTQVVLVLMTTVSFLEAYLGAGEGKGRSRAAVDPARDQHRAAGAATKGASESVTELRWPAHLLC